MIPQNTQPENPEIWLSIDPGLAIIGWAVLANNQDYPPPLMDCGIIKTCSSLNIAKRLAEVHSDFQQLIETFNPSFLAMEQPFFSRQITTAGKVLSAVGAMLAVWGTLKETEPVLLHQASWKAFLISGKANKQDVLEEIDQLYELPAKMLDDTADAIGIGIAAISGIRNEI